MPCFSARSRSSRDDLSRGERADVGFQQHQFEIVQIGFVDFAGQSDDGADRLGEIFAGSCDRLLHAVEEAGAFLRCFFLWFRSLVAFAEEGECHGLSVYPVRKGVPPSPPPVLYVKSSEE